MQHPGQLFIALAAPNARRSKLDNIRYDQFDKLEFCELFDELEYMLEIYMIKFLVFSDLHYDDVEDGDKRIDNILANARSRQLDFIVSLGDLCKPVAANCKVLERFASLGVPFYPVIGNHETDESDLRAIIDFYSLNAPYYSVLHSNYKLIFM